MFKDRRDAGRQLAARLMSYRVRDPVVLALPRGGVPIGAAIARTLDAPLDVVLVRKIGVPFQPELALGAIVDGEAPELLIDDQLMTLLAIPEPYVEQQRERQLKEIERRRRLYLEGRPPAAVAGRTAIVVDDGVATGYTVQLQKVATVIVFRVGWPAFSPADAAAAMKKWQDWAPHAPATIDSNLVIAKGTNDKIYMHAAGQSNSFTHESAPSASRRLM